MTMIEEPFLTDETDGEEIEVSLAEYLAFWGDDRSHAPFYNYGIEGDNLEYLRDDLLPLVERLLLTWQFQKPLDRQNMETVKAFLEAKIKALSAGEEAPPIFREEETFKNENGVVITYAAVRKAMKGQPFDMRLRGDDVEAFEKAVNQGIDGRLQACWVPDRGDKISAKGRISVSVESLPVLLRRLFESPSRNARNLAVGIMSTLGFRDNGQWVDRDKENF